MGTKNNPGEFDCYANAEDDEPMFVLLARDPNAPWLVREWAAQLMDGHRSLYESERDRTKIREANDCDNAMEAWREKNR